MLQRVLCKSKTPQPATGLELLKQKMTYLEEKQKYDKEWCLDALRHLVQAYQGGVGYKLEIATSVSMETGVDLCIIDRLSKLKCKFYGQKMPLFTPTESSDVW